MALTEEGSGPTIECSQNGPYLVRNLQNLRNSKGESIPTKPVIALCRCGGSAKKPFCDGTHSKLGFSSRKVAEGTRDKRQDYVGKGLRFTTTDLSALTPGSVRTGWPPSSG